MESAVVEKTEAELRREIDELHRQQREITARLRDPRGIQRGGLFGNLNSQRGFVRPHGRNEIEDQPAPKKRLLWAVVKLEEGEIDDDDVVKDSENKDFADVANQSERKTSDWPRTVGDQRPWKMMDSEFPPVEHVPRVLPKEEDPSLVKRNKRMLGQLLGTLERFRKEDVKLSGTEAYMRRSDSLKRAEEKAREESERLRQHEREQIAEKRRRDLTLKARIRAKAEEKKLELLFLRWSEHHRTVGNFISVLRNQGDKSTPAESKEEVA